MDYWITQRTPPEVAAQVRAVHMPRTPEDADDEWTKGWRAAVTAIAGFLESDGGG